MRLRSKKIRRLLLVLLALFGLPFTSHAKDDVIAALSSDLPPYQSAAAAFQETLRRPVQVVTLEEGEKTSIKGEPRAIIAFGGKAALVRYPDASALIYGLAPGTQIPPSRRSGSVTEIPMMPKPEMVLENLHRIQPNLHHLTVIWSSPANASYVHELEKIGHKESIEIQIEKLGEGKLPDLLRTLSGRTDALWIPSDPLLINEQNLVLLSQFTASTHIPFYSSIAGLTQKGAAATLSISYRSVGQTAARVTQQILNGSTPPPVVYVDDIDILVNRKAAASLGLRVEGLEIAQR